MGLASSSDVQSRKIDKQIQRDIWKGKTKFKVVLMGTSQAGKSTFRKQLCGIRIENLDIVKKVIYGFVIKGLMEVLKDLQNSGIQIANER